MSGYYFFLGYLPLPITPAALSITTPSMNKTLTLVNEGEINIPKKSGLREISFDFLLPQVTKYPFSHYQIDKYTATLWMEYIKLWKELNWPFMFIVVRMTPKGGLTNILGFTCIKCVIEDFTFDEDADSLGLDVQCSIKLKEYRDYGTKRITLEEARKKFDETYMSGHSVSNQPKQATVTKTRSSNRVAPSKTTIQKGETALTAKKRACGVLDSASSIVNQQTANVTVDGVEPVVSDLANNVSFLEPIEVGSEVDVSVFETTSYANQVQQNVQAVGGIMSKIGNPIKALIIEQCVPIMKAADNLGVLGDLISKAPTTHY